MAMAMSMPNKNQTDKCPYQGLPANIVSLGCPIVMAHA
ncbi:hypothetical protein COLO4_22880 [Corchorus olitorius]|uniref:Uncharacterized protein n=1 Tax=Corchorus olitorius TaxID=93759 RepID=A0A1R3IJH5_9ROSI|nr:hypothetical protein COLO4_22880 [Corchorus olitorius]